MAYMSDTFIDKIIWQSAPIRIGNYEWRAMRYTLPERYGKGLVRAAYQFRRIGQFGAAPELWTDSHDFPGYARYLPNYGLPKRLKKLWSQTGDLLSDDVDARARKPARRNNANKPMTGGLQLGFGF